MHKVSAVLILMSVVLIGGSPKLRIGYYGHSMFEIVLPSGTRIITDPFELATGPAFPFGVVADVVVMSHSHTDHSYSAGVGGEPIEVSWSDGSAYGIDFFATATKHFLDGEEGENHIMTWETEGFKFTHMGDYWDDFSEEDSAALANVTFLFLPVGGYYTMDAELANDIINNTGPIVAFPMHYRTPDHSSGFDDLLTLAEANESLTFPIVEQDPWMAIDPDDLPDGPVIWEPAYSADLPGDLEVTSVDITESPPYMIAVDVANNTPRDADDAALTLNVLDGMDVVYADTTSISVPGDDQNAHEFGPWAPPQSKEYRLFAEVIYSADEVPPNDTLSASFVLTGIDEAPLELNLNLNTSICESSLCIDYTFPGNQAIFSIYDVTGSKIDCIGLDDGKGTLHYEAASFAEGVYFAILTTCDGICSQRITLLR